MTPGTGERLLNVTAAAERLGVARRTVYTWIAAGLLSVRRFGRRGKIKIAETELARFEREQCRRSP